MRGAGALLPLLLAAVNLSCGGSTALSSLVAPSDDTRCQASVAASSTTFGHGGGTTSLTIASERECSWSAASDASWIAVSPTSGQGAGTIRVTVAANRAGNSRVGTVAVNGQRLQFAQDGAPAPPPPPPAAAPPATPSPGPPAAPSPPPPQDDPPDPSPPDTGPPPVDQNCRERFDDSRIDVPATASEHTVALVTSTGCAWQASSTEGWVVVLTRRGEGEVSVSTRSGCSWEASADATWISFAGPPSGSGSGLVRYRVAANASTDERRATLRVAGGGVTITQQGAKPDEKPPKPEKDDVDGTIGGLSGSCPNLSMRVSGTPVVTDRSTAYKGGSCRDLRNGTRVAVKGKRSVDGPILAQRVEIDDRERR